MNKTRAKVKAVKLESLTPTLSPVILQILDQLDRVLSHKAKERKELRGTMAMVIQDHPEKIPDIETGVLNGARIMIRNYFGDRETVLTLIKAVPSPKRSVTRRKSSSRE